MPSIITVKNFFKKSAGYSTGATITGGYFLAQSYGLVEHPKKFEDFLVSGIEKISMFITIAGAAGVTVSLIGLGVTNIVESCMNYAERQAAPKPHSN